MSLRTTIYVRGDRIEYAYHPKTESHRLWFAADGRGFVSACPGTLANELNPYRGDPEVDELFSWLCR